MEAGESTISVTRRTPAEWLQAEYLRRLRKNPRFSLRAFARYLGLPPGRLSELLSERRRLTVSLADRISARLGLTPEDRARLLAQVTKAPAIAPPPKRLLSADEFEVIADWQHFALLSLLETEDAVPVPRSLAARLGISTVEAGVALRRLERLGLVHRKEGLWARTGQPLRTTSDISSAALRRAHRQALQQAIEALEEVPVEERDITSVTFAIDPARLPVAKRMIVEFQSALEEVLERGRRTEVYNLNVQLVPVTHRRKRS